MKNKALFTLLIILLACSAVAQDWQVIDMKTKVDLLGVSFLNRDTGLVVAANGFFLSTVDGGKNWKSFSSGLDLPLTDICHLNGNTIVMCGANGQIFRTTSGIDGWQNVSTGDSTPYLLDIEMFNEKVGMAVGLIGAESNPVGAYALRTTDGGDTWNQLKSMGLGYSGIDYDGKGPVFLMGWGKLNYSEDLGYSWKSVFTIEGGSTSAFSMQGASGILAGPMGITAFTRDRGMTWQLRKRSTGEDYRAVIMLEENIAYIGGEEGVLLKTVDGGRNYLTIKTPVKFSFRDFDIGGNRLYAVGTEGTLIYKELK